MTDNITSNFDITPFGQVLSSYLNIPSGLVMLIIVLSCALVVSLFIYITTGSFISQAIGMTGVLIGGYFLGIIPIYIPSIQGTFSLIYFLYTRSSIPSAETGDEWVAYGNKLKSAYSAKFGSANPAFNDDVDKHITVMQHCNKGFTSTLAYEWLKRMKRFTESK